MKLSIITSVLDSHEIVRRQELHYKMMNIPNVEIIYIDDGSEPPLEFGFKLLRTNDKRAWTEHTAQNMAARQAKGEYLFFIDVDYIVPYHTIIKALQFNGDRMNIWRKFGILNEDGLICSDWRTLKDFGLKRKYYEAQFKKQLTHRNQFLIRKDLFFELGCYDEKRVGKWFKTGSPDSQFWNTWQRAEKDGKVKLSSDRLEVFMYPTGRFNEREDRQNPFGLFHNLKR